ncbi:response regulator transcription factor [Pusillimonas sp. (ex Stolz et al. 2005)]|uniref:response regulator n=1 Tax=Pusillimonas sp. (ex Stolz et al. 2005) TaxID=1979962 RepID=UPI002631F533|nr:response regulator transcription factor [Pusillimonas sp. (ex Stolz et al. 2005)]
MRNSLPEFQAILPSPVLVVEDEPLLQQRLHGILRQLGYASDALLHAASLGDARACLASQPVSLALVDLMLPDGSGLDLIAQMRAESPDMGILVVSAWSSEEAILSALRAGATGYVLKERDDIEVSMSIRSVLRGGAPIDPFIARRILQLLPLGDVTAARAPVTAAEVAPATPAMTLTTAQGETLSDREGQILRLVADGLTNREIAERLFLSRYTVESHIKRIYRKLAVSSRTMAVRAGRARGVVE